MDLASTEVAILLETVNKYTPGTTKYKFRLQSINGLQENSLEVEQNTLSKSNFVNKDTSALPISGYNSSSIVEMTIPKEITRNFPTKFIPPGTRFTVSFLSGDITKPHIIGREFF